MSERIGAREGGVRQGIFVWYYDAPINTRRAFWSCKVGCALDEMDAQLISLILPTLIATWHISRAQAGFLSTAMLWASAMGGWGGGILSDRIGRVKVLKMTILWFVVLTMFCALAQSYNQLITARVFMGLGFGAESTAGAVLISELIQPAHRNKVGGTVQGGWAIGWGVSVLLFSLVYSCFPGPEAWRILFVVGVAPAPFLFLTRWIIDEPHKHGEAMSRERPNGRAGYILEIFAPTALMTTVRAALLATGMQGGYHAIAIWLPTYLKTERHLSVVGTGAYLAVVIVGSYCGYLAGAHVCDKFGRKRTVIGFAVVSMMVVVLYTRVPIGDELMLVLGFPLGFFSSGIFSGLSAFLTELFPTSMRGSGLGFCHNFGRAVGAMFPLLIGRVSQSTMSLGEGIELYAVIAYGLVIVATITLPETQGRVLTC